jgi:hypothetical protein
MSVREKAMQDGVCDVAVVADNTQTVVSVSGPEAAVTRFVQSVTDALRSNQARDGLHTYKSNERAACYEQALTRLRQLLVHMSPQREGSKSLALSAERQVKFS